MVRIADFTNEAYSIAGDTYLDISNPNSDKDAKIKYSNFVNSVRNNINKNIYMSDVTVDATTNTLTLKNSTGVPFKLNKSQGFSVTFKLPKGLPVIKVNPKIVIQDSEPLDVTNGYYYDNYAYEGLDQQTISSIGLNTLVWDLGLQKLKLYKNVMRSGKEFQLYLSSPTHDTNTGWTYWGGNFDDKDNFPIMSRVFDYKSLNLANTTIAGYGDETPISNISEGQVESLYVGNAGSFGVMGVVEGWSPLPTGVFSASNNNNTNKSLSLQTGGVTYRFYNATTTFFKEISIPDATAKTGVKTLTRRFGVVFAIGL